MRDTLKRISPRWLLLLWFRLREAVFFLNYPDRKTRFSKIYSDNLWKNGESASGYGSTLLATRQVRKGLEEVIGENKLISILDIPCGDFNWMNSLVFDGTYIGADIVQAIIEENTRRYSSEKRTFMHLDLVKDRLPEAELVMCRECLNHLSLQEALAAIRNLVQASTKLLAITHYPATCENVDQEASFRYRHLNLTISPFRMRTPDILIDESDSERGKYLAVWDLRISPIYCDM